MVLPTSGFHHGCCEPQWEIFTGVSRRRDMSLKMAYKIMAHAKSASHLIRSLVTSFLFVTTVGLPLSDFEKGFGDAALASAHLQPCLRIDDAGSRALCALTAALEAGAAALEGQVAVPEETCAYRLQGGPSLQKFAAKMHPPLKQVLERYTKLHRHCTGLEYDSLGGMYARKQRVPQCRYVVWSCTFGLGNKLMSLLSTFLYAILSQRVLLIESPGWERLFCAPFLGSRLQV